jgi:hypothetical protein
MENYSDNIEQIEVINAEGTGNQMLWDPEVGEETRRVVEKAPEESQETIQREARETLSKCVPPLADEGQRTGIVVGHIQSGKTLSYTTLCALAHDNGYRLVIVLPGMTTNLLDQTRERLERDLSNGNLHGNWKIYSTGNDILESQMNISNVINEWDRGVPNPDSVLITAMKNIYHLEDVITLLSNLSLDGAPTLVIDDEADQASMNTEANSPGDEESSIHNDIREIRESLPHHTFLQYTATPQAPLLISLIDQLSPDFAQTLTPGDDYTGGGTFFEEYDDELIRYIPHHETPDQQHAHDGPPDSLLDALGIFFVGVAASTIVRNEDTPNNQSMMIHPGRLTDTHDDYFTWVRMIVERWADQLEGEYGDEARNQLVDFLKSKYNDLAEIAHDIEKFSDDIQIPDFDPIVDVLASAIRRTNIQRVNQHTDGVNWGRDFAHVLVGGAKLGRGFTVEGLTVSYMPRGRGVGNADTIQQRARWYGYKSNYLGFCRVFLTPDMVDAYANYVHHEQSMRRELEEQIESGGSLTEWRRRFLLDPGLRPTRRSVLEGDYLQFQFSDSWFNPKVPLEQPVGHHCQLIDSFVSQLDLELDEGHEDRQETQIHQVAHNIPLDWVYEDLLSELSFSDPRDTERYVGLLLQLGEYIDGCAQTPDAHLYKIACGDTRGRSVNNQGKIKQLFQGANPGPDSIIYPGDRQIRESDSVSIQIHHLDLYKGSVSSGELLEENVPVVAIWVPEAAAESWVVR